MRNLPLLALLLTVMLLTPVQGTPIIDEVTTKQTAAPDGRQPSEENTTFWIFGDTGLDRCYGHFLYENATEEGSSNTGNGHQSVSSGRLAVDITCRMDPLLNKEFTLKDGSNIVITLYVEAWGQVGSECGSGNPCKDLTLTLEKGGLPLITNSWALGGGGQEKIDWNIPVNETNNLWSKSEDNPSLRIEFEVQPDSGPECFLVNCDADFYLFYAHPDDEREDSFDGTCDGCNSNIVFPIENITQLGSGVGEEEGNGDGSGSSSTPGFGAALTLLSMMVAIMHISRRRTDTADETEFGKIHF